jgi:hypothetical protein
VTAFPKAKDGRLSLVRLARVVAKRWPPLAAPIYADDNRNLAIAVSALRGIPKLDGEPVYPSDLTAAQARDVALWAAG